MTTTTVESTETAGNGAYSFFALACAATWLLAIPAASAWMKHAAPSPFAIACAGLSAFGLLLAAFVVARRRHQLRAVFGRWRANSGWVVLALLAPPVIHLAATAAFAAIGGSPDA